MDQAVVRIILLVIGLVIILGIFWDGMRRKNPKRTNTEEADDALVALRTAVNVTESPGEGFAWEMDFDNGFEQEVSEEAAESMEDMEELQATYDDDEAGVGESVEDWGVGVNYDLRDDEDLRGDVSAEENTVCVIARKTKAFGGYRLLQALLAHNLHYGKGKQFYYYAEGEHARGEDKALFLVRVAHAVSEFDIHKLRDFTTDKLVFVLNTDNKFSTAEFRTIMQTVAESLASALDGCIE